MVTRKNEAAMDVEKDTTTRNLVMGLHDQLGRSEAHEKVCVEWTTIMHGVLSWVKDFFSSRVEGP